MKKRISLRLDEEHIKLINKLTNKNKSLTIRRMIESVDNKTLEKIQQIEEYINKNNDNKAIIQQLNRVCGNLNQIAKNNKIINDELNTITELKNITLKLMKEIKKNNDLLEALL